MKCFLFYPLLHLIFFRAGSVRLGFRYFENHVFLHGNDPLFHRSYTLLERLQEHIVGFDNLLYILKKLVKFVHRKNVLTKKLSLNLLSASVIFRAETIIPC
nr:MAG TPA: hypothetical protein [Caudoviricetes sp.]